MKNDQKIDNYWEIDKIVNTRELVDFGIYKGKEVGDEIILKMYIDQEIFEQLLVKFPELSESQDHEILSFKPTWQSIHYPIIDIAPNDDEMGSFIRVPPGS